ncbi:MAG: PadR family transcriptional regulator [Saprospiraceae bacterium]|jgi:PadR family transcriptional regulator PadR
MDLENAKAQMRKGVLEMCILAIIAEEEVYPSDIIARLKASDLIVVEGTLYPLLTRLKNDGLVEYTWRESKSGPPRKYFKITDKGNGFLEGLGLSWQQLVQSVAQILEVSGEEKIPEPEPDPEAPETK